MARSHRISRGASAGLAVTLLALTVLSLLGVASTHRSAAAVTRSSALADAYVRAKEAVAAEESLERKYRLEPGTGVLARHAQAGVDLTMALADVQRQGDGDDRALAARLTAQHGLYLEAVHRMFDAVNAGDKRLEMQIDNSETDPAFARMSAEVQAGANAQSRAAAYALAELKRVETLVFYATIAGFTVGLCLLAAFGLVAAGYQRELVRQSGVSEHQALHDALTDLPNRKLFTDRVRQALAMSTRTGQSASIMIFDLDRFKEVNDTFGHHNGDQLLRQVATRVGDLVRGADTVSRLGGDEFAILLPSTDADGAAELAQRILSALHQSFAVDELIVDVEASVGVATAPAHGNTVEEVMRCADVAMHNAKDSKTGIVVYDPTSHVHSPARLTLLGDLRRALEQPDEIILHYQPKVDLQVGEVCGVEALVRWQHATRGLVPPAEFIPVAEGTGLINRLTTHVLRTAIGQLRTWLDDGIRVEVSVNLSPRCLLDAALAARVRDLLEQHAVPPSLLRLEVTETAIMANMGLAMSILTELHALGVRLSVDDYGTGYSSMAYLKRLPVDELKIDRSFVLDMTNDENDAILVRGAIDLGHNLGLTVVAEGVELVEHVAALNQMGCDVGQGYHYARPMPADQLTGWLREAASNGLPDAAAVQPAQ